MAETPVRNVIDVTQALRRVRSKIEAGWRDRSDPMKIYASVKDDVDGVTAMVAPLREYALGIGEMWDTFRSLWGMCVDMSGRVETGAGEGADEGVHPAVSPGHSGEATATGHAIRSGSQKSSDKPHG